MRFSHYLLLLIRPEKGRMHPHIIPAGKASHVKFAGNTYAVLPEYAFLLKGWDPVRNNGRRDWFSNIFDILPTRQVGVLVYREPPQPSDEPVIPLNPIACQKITLTQTPFIIRVLARSKLFERWVRRIPFGTGMSMKFIIIMAVVLIVLFAVLFFGGYYG